MDYDFRLDTVIIGRVSKVKKNKLLTIERRVSDVGLGLGTACLRLAITSVFLRTAYWSTILARLCWTAGTMPGWPCLFV